MAEPKFKASSGKEVYTGNELLLKGALEAGTGLITGYPGSPVAYIFNVASANRDLLKELKVSVQMANNEALSGSRLHGASMAPIRAMTVFKSVGMHVAADGLAIGNLSEPNQPEGGRIVIVGDDPWNSSTQTNTDSRYLAQHLFMPVMEPGTFQEFKDWLNHAYEISGKSNLYIAYLVDTDQADGGATVRVHPNKAPLWPATKEHELNAKAARRQEMVTLPPATSAREESLESRHQKVIELARNKKINHVLYPQTSVIGFVSAGLAYLCLEHALHEMGLTGKFPILKFGITYPIDPQMVIEFASGVDEIFVIEQRRGFMEGQIAKILLEAKQEGKLSREVRVWGKKFPEGLAGIPSVHGLNPSIVEEALIPLLLKWLGKLNGVSNAKNRLENEWRFLTEYRPQINLTPRTATFCPGCPHRDSTAALTKLKEDLENPNYMYKKYGKKEGVQLIFHGDTGCYSMLTYPPNEGFMMNYAGMGLGGGTGAGINPFIRNKQVVFMGDGTFFHSGMIAISDSLKHNQDITYIILDNKTTAMTGHQPNAGDDVDIMGNPTYAQNMQSMVEAMAKTRAKIYQADPAYRETYRATLEEAILSDGVKIVIADKECAITYQRKVKKERKTTLKELGFLPQEKAINITSEVCEYCLECTNTTGCPGLTIEETDLGPKIQTDLSLCVSDGACTKGKVCPSFEEVTILRQGPATRKERFKVIHQEASPTDPKAFNFADTWCCYISGIGGQGTGLLSAILVRAGKEEGLNVIFTDKKGLAIRNGAVFSHILFSKTEEILSPVIPYGKADLVLGMDILETTRALDWRHPIRVISKPKSHVVVSTAKNPTILTLLGKEDFDPKQLEEALKANSISYWGNNLSRVAEELLGSDLYVNIILLGTAFQLGLLPLSRKSIDIAIRASVRATEYEENVRAFELGRKMAEHPEKFFENSRVKTPDTIVAEKIQYLSTGNRRQYTTLTQEAKTQLSELPQELLYHVCLRIYDLINYDNAAYAKKYLDHIIATYRKDQKAFSFAATEAVIRYLYKVMAIKDEIYVAHLLLAPEKLNRDIKRYQIDPKRGDKLIYTHLNRPEFVIFGKKISFDINTKNWMLAIMKRMKFLRKILPGWHEKEKEFRSFYEELADRFTFKDEKTYQLYCKLLTIPEEVRGYREIRYPKMERAYEEARKIFKELEEAGERVTISV